MSAITPELVKEAKDLATQASRLEEKIVERIHEIVTTWFRIFDVKLDTWYFHGAGEGEVGNLWPRFDDGHVWIITELARNKDGRYDSRDMAIIDKDGNEWGWDDSIPIRWLYDDNFEEEIIKGKAEFEKREVERKAKRKELAAAKKLEDEKLIEDAKKKLSKKELAALRRSL